MPHQNSVFHAVVNHIPWASFDSLVKQRGADARARTLRSKDHLLALLYGQLAGAHSIRDITSAMQSHSARLYHLGTRRIARSTLADANMRRPYTLFAGLFAAMVQQRGRNTRRSIGEAVHLIDSTTVSLSTLSAGWARFSADHERLSQESPFVNSSQQIYLQIALDNDLISPLLCKSNTQMEASP